MPSFIEVLIGWYAVMGASAFAAVRMHYANRIRLTTSRWRRACEDALFIIGPVMGAFVIGTLAMPTGSHWSPLAILSFFTLLTYALLGISVLILGWNLAEWQHNRYVRRMMTEAAPLPIARVVTLPFCSRAETLNSIR
jgi:hypothetical protein